MRPARRCFWGLVVDIEIIEVTSSNKDKINSVPDTIFCLQMN